MQEVRSDDCYFQAIGTPVRMGRAFSEEDGASGKPVTVISDTFARMFFKNENPLGKRIVVGRWPKPAEVVGIAADIKNKGLEQDTQAQLYLHFPAVALGQHEPARADGRSAVEHHFGGANPNRKPGP